MEYRLSDAISLVPEEKPSGGRTAGVVGNMTVLHVAAHHAAGAFMFQRICEANGIVDPIPHFNAPPRFMRKGIILAGQTVTIPDDAV